ncbi:MAG: ATP-grasp domain-containing protein [Planctomycetes bacterium]|nr:ATP-grasp domain-containing protein [Planctomycetota bacterium]
MKIALTFSLKRDDGVAAANPAVSLPPDHYAECDSPSTIAALHRALGARGDTIVEVEAVGTAPLRLQAERPDLVFNVAEGLVGPSREAILPAVCELLGIPYTGSDPLALALTLDKGKTSDILASAGLPVAPHVTVRSADEAKAASARIGFPAMVKPLHEGSSKGITNDRVVRNPKALREQIDRVCRHYRQPALVERFLPGREFTVALLGNPPDLRVFPIVEIDYDALPDGANPIYSYEAKWIWDTPERPLAIFQCPARIPPRLEARLSDLARRAFTVLGCRDWARIDLRCDARGRPHLLEVNPLPGVLPNPDENSCYPKAARAAGLTYDAMIQGVVDAACARLGIRRSRPQGRLAETGRGVPLAQRRSAAEYPGLRDATASR